MGTESADVGVVARTGFGNTEFERGAETASTAVAAQAKAMIESRYIMAMRNPRDMDQVRQDLLKECRRPSFAHNKSALYLKPIGKGVEGLGIRFVEVALRCMKNVLCESIMVFADDKREIQRVFVTDLEANSTWVLDVNVGKTVERSKPMDDGSYVSVRMNSYGRQVFTIPATEDDILNKRNAMISKATRTLGLRLIPGDLQDEAEEIIRKIRLDAAAKDPDAERKKIADAFATVNVKVTDLQDYLGHSLDTCTPAELVDLRGLYGALKDGEATWKTAVESRAAAQSTETAPQPTGSATSQVSEAAAKVLQQAQGSPTTPIEEQKATEQPPAERRSAGKAKKGQEPQPPPAEEPVEQEPEPDQAADIAGRFKHHCLMASTGNRAEAEMILSGLTGGKVQKFEDLAAWLREHPEQVVRFGEPMG